MNAISSGARASVPPGTKTAELDNATHTLFALTLARTPLGRAGRGAAVALVLASNAPDIDVVATAGGTGSYLTWHRGPTHGLLGIVGLACVVAGLVSLGLRTIGRSSNESPDAPFRKLVPICLIGVLCHVLMDLPTVYGTRVLSPFDWHWFSLDWMPIIDVYLLGALMAGLLFGSESASARQRNVAIVLVLMGANYGLRAAAHHVAIANAPRLFGPRLPPPCQAAATSGASTVEYWPRPAVTTPSAAGTRCLVQFVAMPGFISPFQWRVVAQLSNAYEIRDIDLLDRRVRQPPNASEVIRRTTLRYPNVWTAPVWTAASTELGRRFLGFSRLPDARATIEPGGTTSVRWDDMRFVGPRGPGLFAAFVRIAADGHVLEERFGP